MKTWVNLLLGFGKYGDEITSLLRIYRLSALSKFLVMQLKLTLRSEESDGGTLGTGTASSSDAMNVVFRVVRIIVVQHMGNVTDILREIISNQSVRRAKKDQEGRVKLQYVACNRLCALQVMASAPTGVAVNISWPGNLGRDCDLSTSRHLTCFGVP